MTYELINRIADAITYHPGNRGGSPEQRERVSREIAKTVVKTLQSELDELAEHRAGGGFKPGMVFGWNDCDPVAVCHCGARLIGDSVNDAVLAWAKHLTSVHKGEW